MRFWVAGLLALFAIPFAWAAPVTVLQDHLGAPVDPTVWNASDVNAQLVCQGTGNGCSSELRGYIYLSGRNAQFAAYNISEDTASNLRPFVIPVWEYDGTNGRYLASLVSDDNYHLLLGGGEAPLPSPELAWFHADSNALQDLSQASLFSGSSNWGVRTALFDSNQTAYFGGTRQQPFSLDTRSGAATILSPSNAPFSGYTSIISSAFARGNVFFGTQDGNLLEYNPSNNTLSNWSGQFNSTGFWSYFPNSRINSMAFDGNQSIYLVGFNAQDGQGRFAKFDLESNTATNLWPLVPSQWQDREMLSVAFSDGMVWVGGPGKFGRFNPSTSAFAIIDLSASGIGSTGVSAITPDYNGALYLTSDFSPVLARYTLASGSFSNLSSRINAFWVGAIIDSAFKRDVTKYRADQDAGDGVSYGLWNDFDQNVLFSRDGNFAIQFFSADRLLDRESVKTQFVLVDQTPPATTSDANDGIWQRNNASVRLYCSDNASDCNQTFYRADSNSLNGEQWSDWNEYTGAPIDFSGDGNWSLEFYSNDLAGNAESVVRQSVLISDPRLRVTSAPTLSFVDGLMDFSLFAQGLYGRADAMALSDFNVSYAGLSWGLPAGDANVTLFSNLGDGNYSIRLKAPSVPGTYRFTFVAVEPVTGVVLFDQNDVEVRNHVLSLRIQYHFGEYALHEFSAPPYVPPIPISMVSPQQTPAGSQFIDFAASARNELVGVVSTNQGIQFDFGQGPVEYSVTQLVSSSGTPNELYLVFSMGNFDSIRSRLNEIRQNLFLSRDVAAFGFASPSEKTITVGIDYYGSDIDLNESSTLPLGDYTILVQNTGSQGGRAQVSVRRT